MHNLFTVILVFSMFFVQGQDRVIHFERGSNKPFIVDNKAYFFKEREKIFANEEALALLRKARGQAIFSQVVGGVGGGFFGAALADVLFPKSGTYNTSQLHKRKSVRNVFFVSGIALAGISIPMGKSAIRKMKQAVDIENDAIATALPPQTLRFHIGTDGIGIACNF